MSIDIYLKNKNGVLGFWEMGRVKGEGYSC
jgi:hypothetical protein